MKNILIAARTETACKAYAEMLDSSVFRVTEMTDAGAIRFLDLSSYSAALFSLPLADENGLALIEELHQRYDTPLGVIIKPDIPDRLLKRLVSANAYILKKPVSHSNALLRSAEHIRSSAAAEDYAAAVREYFEELSATVDDSVFLNKIQTYIAGNEGSVVSTQEAAGHFGFNKDYFGRMFRQRMGMTFGEFYKRFRMRYAEKLLLSGRYKVGEIAGMLGFATADYFTAEFHRYTGRRPLEVKNRK